MCDGFLRREGVRAKTIIKNSKVSDARRQETLISLAHHRRIDCNLQGLFFEG
jgi:hypothetical protein